MLRHCKRLSIFGQGCRNLAVPSMYRPTGQNNQNNILPASQTLLHRHFAPPLWTSTFAHDATATPAQQIPSVDTKTSEQETTTASPIVDPQAERKLKILELEVEVLRQEGRKVPSALKSDQWEHLLTLQSKSARAKFYSFLWTVEMKRENEKLRRAERREQGVILQAERRREHAENTHIVYSLSGVSMFLRIYETTMNHWHNNKLHNAAKFGQKLVLDCSYDEHMTRRECILAAKQLMLCFAENREHDQPFDLHYCNADMAGATMTYLKRYIPTMLDVAFPMNVHAGSYLDHFRKEQLVYLTPHCKNDLTEYNPDDVYIIGAMVDTMNNEALSLAKAKKLGLRMARLPLDRYLQWGAGSGKSLTLNQMTHIMLDLKDTGDWQHSLRHVPRRKLVNENAEEVATAERTKWTKSATAMRMRRDDGDESVLARPRSKTNSWTTSAVKPAAESEQGADAAGQRVNKFRRKTNV